MTPHPFDEIVPDPTEYGNTRIVPVDDDDHWSGHDTAIPADCETGAAIHVPIPWSTGELAVSVCHSGIRVTTPDGEQLSGFQHTMEGVASLLAWLLEQPCIDPHQRILSELTPMERKIVREALSDVSPSERLKRMASSIRNQTPDPLMAEHFGIGQHTFEATPFTAEMANDAAQAMIAGSSTTIEAESPLTPEPAPPVPTVGRIVRYVVASTMVTVLPAIITAVHGDSWRVNLEVFGNVRDKYPRDVEWQQGLPTLTNTWHWPERV